MLGGSGVHSKVQFSNDWVPLRGWAHWDYARDAIGEMLSSDFLGENRLPGTPLMVPQSDVYLARRKAALNMLDVIPPASFAIHDNLLIGIFDMLDRAMRNPNLDVMKKAALAAKLAEAHGEEKPDVLKRATDVLSEALAVVHRSYERVTDPAKLEEYDAQMAQLLGRYSKMSAGAWYVEGAERFFISLQHNARTEGVKVVAGLFAGDSCVPCLTTGQIVNILARPVPVPGPMAVTRV